MRGLILTLIAVTGLFAQTYSVNGTVTDQYLLDYLEGINVSAFYLDNDDPIATETTDESGSYSLTVEPVSTIINTPNTFRLYQNYPNPYNPSTIIPLSIEIPGTYSLKSYNVLGQTLAHTEIYLLPGSHQISYDGASGSAGLHLIELSGNGQRSVIKTLLMDRSDGTGFSRRSGAKMTHLAKPALDLELRLSFSGPGYVTRDTVATLGEGATQVNLSLRRDSYPPIMTLEIIVDTLEEAYYQPSDSIRLATYSLFDPDVGDTHTITLFNGSPDDMLMELNGNIIHLLYSDSDFNGVFQYGIIAEDAAGLIDTALAQVVFTPVNDAPQVAGWISDFTTNNNSELEIDLVNHFVDADGDPLTRSLIGIDPEHYESQVDDNGILRLTTNYWYGVMENIRAVATDGELADTSNAFNITVNLYPVKATQSK